MSDNIKESWASKALRRARSAIFPGQEESLPLEINETMDNSSARTSKPAGLLHRVRSVLLLQRHNTNGHPSVPTDSDIKSYSSLSGSSPAVSIRSVHQSLGGENGETVSSFNKLRRRSLDVSSLVGKSISMVSSSLKGKQRDQSAYQPDNETYQWIKSTEFCSLDTCIPDATIGVSFTHEESSNGCISEDVAVDNSGFETVKLYGGVRDGRAEAINETGSASPEWIGLNDTSNVELHSDILALSEKAMGKQRAQLTAHDVPSKSTIASPSISSLDLVRSSSMIGRAGSMSSELDHEQQEKSSNNSYDELGEFQTSHNRCSLSSIFEQAMKRGACGIVSSPLVWSPDPMSDVDMPKNVILSMQSANNTVDEHGVDLEDSSHIFGNYHLGEDDGIECDMDSVGALDGSIPNSEEPESSHDFMESKYHIDCYLPGKMTPSGFWSSLGHDAVHRYPRLEVDEWHRMVEVRAGVRNTTFMYDRFTGTECVDIEDSQLNEKLNEAMEKEDGIIDSRVLEPSSSRVTASELSMPLTQGNNTTVSTQSDNGLLSALTSNMLYPSGIFGALRTAKILANTNTMGLEKSSNNVKENLDPLNVYPVTSTAVMSASSSSRTINQLDSSFLETGLYPLERVHANQSKQDPKYFNSIWTWANIREKA